MNLKKKPWPTKEAMEQIYQMKLWGSNNTEFYSGEGSHHSDIISPYVTAVTSFLTSFTKPITVCDLGCGDFNVGKHFVQHTKSYIAVDIVEDLIQYNKKVFQKDNLEFSCIDISTDVLPKGDCVLIRQVLQHLSNKEIQSIVNKLSDFKYIILTEHIPEGRFIPNVDIISGQGIRLKKKSGVDLFVSPFNFKVKSKKELISTKLTKGKGKIVTMLLKVS